MMKSLSNTTWTKNIINKMAKRSSDVCPGRYMDREDFTQDSWLAILEAIDQYDCLEDISRPYIYTVLLRQTKRSRLRSVGILKVPDKTRAIIEKIRKYLKKGIDLSEILSRLGISDKEWGNLKGLLESHRIPHPSINTHTDFAFILRDILAIPTLTDLEKRIILTKVDCNQDFLNISRTTIWKCIKDIRRKLAKGGYVA